jgi:hypothetical protein
MTLNITIVCYYAECPYAEFHILLIIMLNVVMLSAAMLNVVAPIRSQHAPILSVYEIVRCFLWIPF